MYYTCNTFMTETRILHTHTHTHTHSLSLCPHHSQYSPEQEAALRSLTSLSREVDGVERKIGGIREEVEGIEKVGEGESWERS